KVVTLVAVIDEQPVLPRAMGCSQVWTAFHLECRVELCKLRGIPALARGRPPAGIVERDRPDCRRLVFPPFDSTLGQEIGHGDRFSSLVHHPEVLDVNAEQLATVLAEIPIVEPDQAYQVGIDPEVGGTCLVSAVVAGTRPRGRQLRGGLACGR